jgi:curved DNA-binding protein CbpA
MVVARTLYDVLGVSPGATAEEMRQAYRERARVLHPDRLRARGEGGTESLGLAMGEVNDAWRVLRDPAARMAYDRSLAASARPALAWDERGQVDGEEDLDRPFRGRPAELGDLVVALVRALPWLIVGLILGGIFVFSAFAAGGGAPPSRQLVGDCVRASSSLLEVVPCAPGGTQVVAVTRLAAECPTASNPVSSGHDRVVCLRPFPGTSP